MPRRNCPAATRGTHQPVQDRVGSRDDELLPDGDRSRVAAKGREGSADPLLAVIDEIGKAKAGNYDKRRRQQQDQPAAKAGWDNPHRPHP